MSGTTRYRDGWLPVLLCTVFFVLVRGSGAALPAVGGGPAGGHAGGVTGGSHPGANLPRGREFGGGRFDGRRFHHGHGRPEVFLFPYFYDPYYGYDPYYPDYPYDSYCDPYSPSYTPQYCYWDYGP